jgi:hypothetical protein
LGKLIAISLSWPTLYRDIVEEPDLLIALQQVAVGQTPKPAQHLARWRDRPELMDLLRAGCLDEATGQIEPQHGYDWLMTDLDVERLIQIAPPVQRPARPEPTAVEAGRVAAQATGPELRPITWRVLAVTYNPVVDKATGQRLIEMSHWTDPGIMMAKFQMEVIELSGGLVRFEIVEQVVRDDFPPKEDGFRYDAASYPAAVRAAQFHVPDLADYNPLIQELRLLERIANKDFDEVWLFGGPGFGFYESRMAGPDAIWCNGPPLSDTGLSRRRFVIMGFSYERDNTGEMLESYGHRAENILSHIYRDFPAEKNLYRQFSQYEAIASGQANCGTLHWAPNSVRDYDWGNTQLVDSNCDAWLSFPDLTGPRRAVNCTEWGNGDPRLHHLWWFQHLPHAPGATNGILNNWWTYVIDPNQAGSAPGLTHGYGGKPLR